MSHTGDDDIAANRLRLLQQDFLEPGRPSNGVRVSRSTTPSAPLRLDMVDHIQASVSEIEEHTRAEAPDAGARPAAADRVYEWAYQRTRHLDPQRRLVLETVVYRQSLEHAIAMGDHSVVRRHSCPACGTWGLFWRPGLRKAVCVNHYCTDDQGRPRSWPLAHLAHRHVVAQAARKNLNVNAT
ncbi:hypothetical protein [Streptomyces sp. NPDC101145]|uniref:hypothetical protein n=1 Tax=Streptomyces sp. NPDC101145 TaxID=3366112 RepID=UPI003810489C